MGFIFWQLIHWHSNPNRSYTWSGPVWPLNFPNGSPLEEVWHRFSHQKKISITDHHSYIVSHQSSLLVKKGTLLTSLQFLWRKRLLHLSGMNVQEKFFEKHQQQSFVRDGNLIILLCDSCLHLTRSLPFETIEYCAPTSLRRLVPFPTAFSHLVNKRIVTILKQAFQVSNEQELKL